jgi:hypothetical protein
VLPPLPTAAPFKGKKDTAYQRPLMVMQSWKRRRVGSSASAERSKSSAIDGGAEAEAAAQPFCKGH